MDKVDPKLADYSYGPESYDATMLIALAAYAANSTEGADIAEYLVRSRAAPVTVRS